MGIKIIEQRLKEYASGSKRDEFNALKEIAQEIALSALARTDFFEKAAFQGGSCLRIVHQLNRFSEDLDFILLEPDKSFVWLPFFEALQAGFKFYDLELQVIDRSKADNAVKLAFIKDTSFGKVLVLAHPRGPSDPQSIQIKLEIDTNPPAGSLFETQFLNFPYPFSILVQDLPSLFASKCHALLCRPYVKGRDWFDFVWYISKKIVPNYKHLHAALFQAGPWRNQNITITSGWLVAALREKIVGLDWELAKTDAAHFLSTHEQVGLKVWGNEYFLALTKKLEGYQQQP